MSLFEITEQSDWQSGQAASGQTTFLQSWEWGAFQAAVGQRPVRLGVQAASGSRRWQVQGFVYRLAPGVAYLYCPHVDVPEQYVPELLAFARARGCAFVRIESLSQTVPKTGFLTHPRQDGVTLLLDLRASHDELLADMHAKTRYNIRLAERKGIAVRLETNPDVFWRLHTKTIARDRIGGHDRSYYEQLLKQPSCEQLTVYTADNVPVASMITWRGKDTYIYVHGASDHERRSLMAPYLLQWKGIEHARKEGFTFYDFRGVALSSVPASESKERVSGNNVPPPDNKQLQCFHRLCWRRDDPRAGITRFKAGFGGQLRRYGEAYEVPVSRLRYTLYIVARKLRGYR